MAIGGASNKQKTLLHYYIDLSMDHFEHVELRVSMDTSRPQLGIVH